MRESKSPWLVVLGLGLAILSGCTDPIPATETGDPTSSTSQQTETETGDTTGMPDMGGTTGEPEPVCGDGTLDPGEACDDGNLVAGDGCSPDCEIGPCGFEWTSRELVLTTNNFEVTTPTVLVDENLLVAHQLGAQAEQVGILGASSLDGAAFSSTTLELGDDKPVPHALAVGADGASFVASSDILAGTSSIRRFEADQTTSSWVHTRDSVDHVVDLRPSPDGSLILLDTADDGPMNQDVALAALDPLSGEELWTHQFGGPPADNGFSTDRAAALDVDASGRIFVAYDEYRAWDTSAPVVVAFGPGDPQMDGPLWTTTVFYAEGRQLEVSDLDVGPDGTLALTFIRWDGSQIFWVAALDADSGELEWVVERDDFDLPNKLSTIRGVTVLADRVLAVGTWLTTIEGLEVRQGFVLGLGLDGSLACVGTSDDVGPGAVSTSETHLPLTLVPRPEGGAYASGYVNDFGRNRIDLWLAQIR